MAKSKRTKTHLSVATSDDGARTEVYRLEAERLEMTLSNWVFWVLDAQLEEDIQATLPAIKSRGESGRGR